MKTRTSRDISAVKLADLRQDLVTRQLDDLNVLSEALVAALNENDDLRTGIVRVSMARFALAMG
jgi:N-glycosylase/DNA lyase